MAGGRDRRPKADARRRQPDTRENSLDKRIGPFYDTKAVSALLRVSPSTVYRRVERQELLGLRTSDDQYLFPAWQFEPNGQVPNLLSEVLPVLDPGRKDPWGTALWLSSPATFLAGDRPIDRIKSGDVGAIISVAARIGVVQESGL